MNLIHTSVNTLKSLSITIIITFLTGCLDPNAPGNLVPATVDDDLSLPSIELNNSKFHIRTYGNPNNQPIIFLHGGPGNDFKYMLPMKDSVNGRSLQDNYYLIYWDQRGSGLSRRHKTEEITLENYLKDIEELTSIYCNDSNVIFIGHSWGGAYAAMYMNSHPEKVKGAILMEAGPFSSEITTENGYDVNYFTEWVNDIAWTRQFISMNDHESADYVFSTIFINDSEMQPDRITDSSLNLVPCWRNGAAVVLELSINILENEKFNFSNNLKSVIPEVLFIVGSAPSDLGKDFQEKQINFFNAISLKIVPESGHNDIVSLSSSLEHTMTFIFDYLDSI